MLFLKVLFFFFFTCHFIFFFWEATTGMGVHSYFGFWWGGFFFFRKIVTVISIFFTQLLGCFVLNLMLLRGAKLKPPKSKYLCLQIWCDNTLYAKFSTGGRVQECPQRVGRYFSHCPHWILVHCIQRHLCVQLAKNQLNSPGLQLLWHCRRCASGSLMSGGVWQQPHSRFLAPVGVDQVCSDSLSPNELDVEMKSPCSRFQFHCSFSFEQIKLMTGLKLFLLKL